MKTNFLYILILLVQFQSFGQENPWEKKSTKNPWETTEEKETAEKKKTVEHKDEIDTTANITAITSEQTLSDEASNRRIYLAQQKARMEYKSSGDFAVGFVSGLVLNFVGIPIAGAAAFIPNKKELKIIENTLTDETYEGVDKEKLETKTRNSITGKKVATPIGGVFLGALTQVGCILLLINL